jgi:hypothetical protein
MPDGEISWCAGPVVPGRAYCQHHLSLYCAKTTMQRDRLDAAARKRQTQMVSFEEQRQANALEAKRKYNRKVA